MDASERGRSGAGGAGSRAGGHRQGAWLPCGVFRSECDQTFGDVHVLLLGELWLDDVAARNRDRRNEAASGSGGILDFIAVFYRDLFDAGCGVGFRSDAAAEKICGRLDGRRLSGILRFIYCRPGPIFNCVSGTDRGWFVHLHADRAIVGVDVGNAAAKCGGGVDGIGQQLRRVWRIPWNAIGWAD